MQSRYWGLASDMPKLGAVPTHAFTACLKALTTVRFLTRKMLKYEALNLEFAAFKV
jgi:hypothetical protein